MIYQVCIGYMNGEKTQVHEVHNVFEVEVENGVYVFRDDDLHIVFSAPFDSVIYMSRISLG